MVLRIVRADSRFGPRSTDFKMHILVLLPRRRDWGSREDPWRSGFKGRAPTSKRTRERREGFQGCGMRTFARVFEEELSLGESQTELG